MVIYQQHEEFMSVVITSKIVTLRVLYLTNYSNNQ